MSGLSAILRDLRMSQGHSQLELALRLGISQRHVSFVELGRAMPSRRLILAWARATDASREACNAALGCAGLAPAEPGIEQPDAHVAPATKALTAMIAAHDPFPGIIFDADWIIRAMNEGARSLESILMPEYLASLEPSFSPRDMIMSLAHPKGLLTHLRDGADIGYALFDQLKAEQLARPQLRRRVDRLEAALATRFGPERPAVARAAGNPHLNIIADTPLGRLSFLIVQCVYGLPQNVTQHCMRTELWFPTDEETRAILSRWTDVRRQPE